jgi:hypothetical protein
MIKLFDRFRAGQPSSAVPASWFNAVAGWLNHLRGEGVGCEVTVTKPDHPSEANPPVIRVRVNQAGGAQLSTQLPVADSENGSSGESDKAARGDHSHPHSAKLIEVYAWAQNFDASLDQLFANDQTLYNNQNGLWADLNDLWADLNSLNEWSDNVAAWSNNVSTDINTLFDAVNRIYYYWRGGYFG